MRRLAPQDGLSAMDHRSVAATGRADHGVESQPRRRGERGATAAARAAQAQAGQCDQSAPDPAAGAHQAAAAAQANHRRHLLGSAQPEQSQISGTLACISAL